MTPYPAALQASTPPANAFTFVNPFD